MKQLKTIIDKASVLVEALPYIQQFRDEIVVIKFGGSAMENRECYDGILTDAAFMECVGMRPVIIHGGGKAISRRMNENGIRPRFVQGLRVTDMDAIRIVDEVLTGEVNPAIVETLKKKNALAKGFRGQDVFSARRMIRQDPETGKELDFGFVGNITHVKKSELESSLKLNVIPVITPLAVDNDGNVYNTNADEAAAAVATALRARKLVFLSDVPGLLRDEDDPDSVMTTLHVSDVDRLVEQKVIEGGMLPKVSGAVSALASGVRKAHIIDGRLPHSLLLEIFTDKGVGTEIIHNE